MLSLSRREVGVPDNLDSHPPRGRRRRIIVDIKFQPGRPRRILNFSPRKQWRPSATQPTARTIANGHAKIARPTVTDVSFFLSHRFRHCAREPGIFLGLASASSL